MENSFTGLEVAVVGMAGQFPGADNVSEFWEMLRGGIDGISSLTEDELKANGVPKEAYSRENYISAKGIINHPFKFAADYFGINHSDAVRMDPQIRLMIENCWQALNHANIDSKTYSGKVGVFAGASSQWSWFKALDAQFSSAAEQFHVATLNDPSFCTRISYLLNLRGPSVTIQTACSTSLVAIHMACQALQAGECDVALAGGVSVTHPHKSGYLYQEGMINSPDGKTRVFDENACGTVFSNGVGVVALKRLDDAIQSGDRIFAIVKGSAVNNDGSDKISFTAPSELGQKRVIQDALEYAEVDAEQISYIEAHGTGTLLGDPIELSALKGVFQGDGSCALGSVKSNVGHCDAAAGVLAFIKVALCTYFKTLVPTLHFKKANPKLDLDNSPFYVNTETKPWDVSHGDVRLAGVSAFGVGGTNAHVILQEYGDGEQPSLAELQYQSLPDRLEFRPAANAQQERVQPAKVAEVRQARTHSLDEVSLQTALLEMLKTHFAKDAITLKDNFFDAGASSLDIAHLHDKVNTEYGLNLKISDYYRYSNCEKLAQHICSLGDSQTLQKSKRTPQNTSPISVSNDDTRHNYPQHAVAVVGMSGRFPGSENIQEYWQNLLEGHEGISFFSDEELLEAGVPAAVLQLDNYIKAKGVLSSSFDFDPEAFAYTVRESQYMDPQFRLLHEATWQVLDDAGYGNQKYRPITGLFASCGSNHEWLERLKKEVTDSTEQFGVALLNDREFLTTRVAYKLNLTGPAVTVQSACSSSALAITLACQSLYTHQCDLALAGGVSITTPVKSGYMYARGMVNSSDGHCRPFTQEASGTVFSDGLGMVALKRLEDALRDNDNIYGVIAGFGVNNDGHDKTGYTAPNANGQASCIRQSLNMAGVKPDDIEFLEAHGTATLVGDEIEIEGIKEALGASDKNCVLGSVKSNIGHTNTAAGVASFIKTILALKYETLPMSCHVTETIPDSLSDTRFTLIDKSRRWKSDNEIRTAGVSSFGIGGTNVHLTVKSIEQPVKRDNERSELVILSSKNQQGLAKIASKLHDYIQHADQAPNLTDLAYTLQLGRGEFDVRSSAVVDSIEALSSTLSRLASGKPEGREASGNAPGLVFMFPGQGAQYVEMAKGLYHELDTFKNIVDTCHQLLREQFNIDLLSLLYSDGEDAEERSLELQNTRITQPVIFVVSYALAKCLESFGIRANAMIGHSVGEYVAATLAEVMTLEEALKLVASRGLIMQECEPGAMLSVASSREKVEPFLTDSVTLATINSPNSCVVAGPVAEIKAVQERLSQENFRSRLLKTSHAFHTAMMLPGVDKFRAELDKVDFKAPKAAFLSNVTGQWIQPEEACSADYWIKHLCQAVEFQQGIETCLQKPELNVFLEVGPGRTLSTFVKQIADSNANISVFNLLRHPLEEESDRACLLKVLGELWSLGCSIDWTVLYQHVSPGRISLPGYQFIKEPSLSEYHISSSTAGRVSETKVTKKELTQWLYTEQWQPVELPTESTEQANNIVCFVPDLAWCNIFTERFNQEGKKLKFIVPSPEYYVDGQVIGVTPGDKNSFDKLMAELAHSNFLPDSIIFAWPLSGTKDIMTSWFAVILLLQSWGKSGHLSEFRLLLATTALPEHSLLNGLIKVIAQEVTKCHPRIIELDTTEPIEAACDILAQELTASDIRFIVKRSQQARFEKRYEQFENANVISQKQLFKKQGVYLITGGLGDLGLLFAEHLVTQYGAKVILSGRRDLPRKAQWGDAEIKAHPQSKLIDRIHQLSLISDGDIDYYAADVCDRQEMEALIGHIEAQYGQLNGVICAAGVTRGDSFQGINHITMENCQPQFDTKVYSYQLLAELLEHKQIDFCLLCSSIAAILGGLSFSAYSSVSSFADAFAKQQNQLGKPWISINWDGWVFERKDADDVIGSSLEQLLIEPDEGLSILERVLQSPLEGQLIVSTGDLNQRFEQWVGTHIRPFTYQSHPAYSKQIFSKQQIVDTIMDIWKNFLKIHSINSGDNFFELGANSLDLVQVNKRITEALYIDLSVVDMFSYPTSELLADFIIEQNVMMVEELSAVTVENNQAAELDMPLDNQRGQDHDADISKKIAIVGIAATFPEAENIYDFWQNLTYGKESISIFSKEELLEEGIDLALLDNPNYIRAKGVFPNAGEFDAAFFGYTPYEARQMDPQVRAFHACCWQALQDAGVKPKESRYKIGLYAAASGNLQWLAQAMATAEGSAGQYSAMTVADKDYMATIVSYKLNLTGPSMVLSTACSSSLVAVNEAIKSLRAGECDVALAGGVSITLPTKAGYLSEEGMIHAKDGKCRPFDIQASGTVFGDGVGVVVLKPLQQALKDNDNIYATIIGTAINNDGGRKVGYTAPSYQGQIDVIQTALKDAHVSADTLSFVEAHGTGTHLGDPIEFKALKQAFATDKKNFCKLGSVKSNIGHLNSAAGIAGLIKAAMALKYKELPPTINFARINAEIDIVNSPFIISNQYSRLDDSQGPLRAGVSSFGIGGTNAHVVLEQAPSISRQTLTKGQSGDLPIVLSAPDEKSLDSYKKQLKRAIQSNVVDSHINELALSLMQREVMPYLFAAYSRDREGLLQRLSSPSSDYLYNGVTSDRKVVYLFPGQGMQYAAMGLSLYHTNDVFKTWCDRGFEIASEYCTIDLKQLFLAGEDDEKLYNTEFAQPLMFIIEYSLVQILASYGVKPAAMLGHSLGEYVAAAVAEIFSFADAVRMVCARGRLMQSTEAAAMLSVMCSAQVAQTMLFGHLEIALDNSSELCVLSGSDEEITKFEQLCEPRSIKTKRLKVSRAFHSRYMEPILADYERVIGEVKLSEPKLPIISNVTGALSTKNMMAEPHYWVGQIREPVRFTQGLEELLASGDCIFVEIGPGNGLSSLVKHHQDFNAKHLCISLMSRGKEEESCLIESLGMLSLLNVNVSWRHELNEMAVPPVNLPPMPIRGKEYPKDVKRLQAIFSGKAGSDVTQVSTQSVARNPVSGATKSKSVEEELKVIWKNVLGVSDVNGEDDFITLGGTSLSAVQVIAKAKSVQIPIDMNMLLSRKSLNEIICLIDPPNSSNTMGWQYNTQFKPEFYGSDASCMYSAVREKLKHDYGLNCPDSLMRASDGSLLFGFGVQPSDSQGNILSDYQNYGALLDWPQLPESFSFSYHKQFFDDLESYTAYCINELEKGKLVIVTGSDYYLPFSPSYGLSHSEYLLRPLFDNIAIDEEEVIPHAFVLVGRTQGGYQVYDGSFNYFGEISDDEFAQTVIGFKGLDFMKSHEVYHKSRSYLAISVVQTGAFLPTDHLLLNTLDKTLSGLQTHTVITNGNTPTHHYVGIGAVNKLMESPELLLGMTLGELEQFVKRWLSQLELLHRFLAMAIPEHTQLWADNVAGMTEALRKLITVDNQNLSANDVTSTMTLFKQSLESVIGKLM
ncbi:type I polyketide synthase [Photorhabdus luminescens]|uniref:SDR family NAD(P)-dependent oxidoreductase n=1 Tax=Photorhabdus luminescens subsp. sonorensis TaxID=1173677 RepID=A0A5C4RM99_PHOLU|nr:type I polyketide synthase [Photorhabdus luminescens]TNH44821.1 SDR family NAD(P)-dependent oxidoreductase [Photorhabdus luminescens subsp. sonorensis]